jgi:NAD(P)-dependent dehydrogenase (short-subunit alcohol dehydrogenase family)
MYKVLVTGGTAGIGLAVVQRLRGAGYEVIACARGNEAEIRCDVTRLEEVEGMVRQTGPIDVLVNNAGVAITAPFLDLTEKQWDEQFQVNLKSAFYCTKMYLPGMLAKRWGRIVNIASTAGKAGYKYVSAYVAAKHAIVGLTRALALEVAEQGVTVNAVCPSFVDTPMLRESTRLVSARTGKTEEELLNRFRNRNPQKRLISAEEVAAAVQFLIENPGINGQALSICGGEIST